MIGKIDEKHLHELLIACLLDDLLLACLIRLTRLEWTILTFMILFSHGVHALDTGGFVSSFT